MSTARHDLAPPAAPGCLLRALAVCLLVLSAVWPAEGRGGLVRVSHATLDGTPRQVLLAEDGAFRGVLRYRGLGCESDPEARRLAVLHGRLLRPLTGVHVVEEGRRIDLAAGEWLEDDDAFPCASLPLALVFEGDGGRTDEVAEADCHAILVTARAPGPGLTLRRADTGSMLVCRPGALERLLEGRPAFVAIELSQAAALGPGAAAALADQVVRGGTVLFVDDLEGPVPPLPAKLGELLPEGFGAGKVAVSGDVQDWLRTLSADGLGGAEPLAASGLRARPLPGPVAGGHAPWAPVWERPLGAGVSLYVGFDLEAGRGALGYVSDVALLRGLLRSLEPDVARHRRRTLAAWREHLSRLPWRRLPHGSWGSLAWRSPWVTYAGAVLAAAGTLGAVFCGLYRSRRLPAWAYAGGSAAAAIAACLALDRVAAVSRPGAEVRERTELRVVMPSSGRAVVQCVEARRTPLPEKTPSAAAATWLPDVLRQRTWIPGHAVGGLFAPRVSVRSGVETTGAFVDSDLTGGEAGTIEGRIASLAPQPLRDVWLVLPGAAGVRAEGQASPAVVPLGDLAPGTSLDITGAALAGTPPPESTAALTYALAALARTRLPAPGWARAGDACLVARLADDGGREDAGSADAGVLVAQFLKVAPAAALGDPRVPSVFAGRVPESLTAGPEQEGAAVAVGSVVLPYLPGPSPDAGPAGLPESGNGMLVLGAFSWVPAPERPGGDPRPPGEAVFEVDLFDMEAGVWTPVHREVWAPIEERSEESLRSTLRRYRGGALCPPASGAAAADRLPAAAAVPAADSGARAPVPRARRFVDPGRRRVVARIRVTRGGRLPSCPWLALVFGDGASPAAAGTAAGPGERGGTP